MMNSLVTSLYSANKSPSVKAQDGSEISADSSVQFTIDRIGDKHSMMSQASTVTSASECVSSIFNTVVHPSNYLPPSNVIIIDEHSSDTKSCAGAPGTSNAPLQNASRTAVPQVSFSCNNLAVSLDVSLYLVIIEAINVLFSSAIFRRPSL